MWKARFIKLHRYRNMSTNESLPDVAELSCSMNRKLWPLVTAGYVRICTIVQQEIHTSLVTFLRG